MSEQRMGKRLRHLGLFAFMSLGLLLSSCKKEESGGEGGQIRPPEAGGIETAAQREQLAVELKALQERIRLEPQNVELRRLLLARAVDGASGRIRGAGVGLVPANAASPAMALQGAERAAFIDACRWIAYVQAWQRDVTTPDFGLLQGQVPPARLVAKQTAADQVVVLVEAGY